MSVLIYPMTSDSLETYKVRSGHIIWRLIYSHSWFLAHLWEAFNSLTLSQFQPQLQLLSLGGAIDVLLALLGQMSQKAHVDSKENCRWLVGGSVRHIHDIGWGYSSSSWLWAASLTPRPNQDSMTLSCPCRCDALGLLVCSNTGYSVRVLCSPVFTLPI